MTTSANLRGVLQTQLRFADGFAFAVVITLPWSISAALIFIVLWTAVVIAALGPKAIHNEIMTIAGGTPILLLCLGVIGMFWANANWPERLGGVDSFLKLLAIPFLLAHFRRSNRAPSLLIGYLSSCAALLAYSWAVILWPLIGFHSPAQLAPQIKNAITETSEFIFCGFVLIFMAAEAFRGKAWWLAVTMSLFAYVFLANVIYVLIVPGPWFIMPGEIILSLVVLLLLIVLKQFGPKAMLGVFAAGAIVCSFVYVKSPTVKNQIGLVELFGGRPAYWSKSLSFIAEAPILGHGTGSIGPLFAGFAKGQTGTMAEITTNPFQESLSVWIQLGALGTAALWAMWIAHLLLFRGKTLTDSIGLIIVVSTIAASMSDSELFDAHRGWAYVFGVGIAGGHILRFRAMA